jgi:type I restriction enzyme S subunit
MAKPEIRLKGFEGEWKKKKIGELSDILTGYPFEGSSIKKNGKYLLMRGINITEGYIRHSDDIDRYYDGDINLLTKYILDTNDLVIGMDGSKVGKNSALVTDFEKGSLLVQRVARLRNSNTNVIRLIQIALRSTKFIQYVEENKTSSAIPHISPSDIYNFEISLSEDANEQKWVADYFKSLDSMIQGVTKKITSLKQMKQACLVSMFPQEGETTPRVRFKGFKGEWNKKLLKECLEISNEKNFDNKYGKNDVLSVSDDFGVMNQIELLGRSYAGKSVSNYGILKTGEIVYTKSPLKSKPFGIIKQNFGKAGIVSVLYAVYYPKEGTAGDYIHYYFDPDWRLNAYLRPLVNKGAKNTMNISDETALTGYIMIPKDINEQQQIASFFRSLDSQISLQELRLEKLKQIKSACLDKMFV